MSAERASGRTALLVALAGALLASATTSAAAPARARLAAVDRASATSGPFVQVMVVGAGNVILFRATAISAPPTTVKTAHGNCAVAEGTPLGALAILNRFGGPSFALRDYGHCTGSPADSGQLFVSSLDGETGHGQNGWEYKVNGRSGSTGAADPSGPFGNGHKIASGSKVLWFWCESFGGGCQRTLEVSTPASVGRGSSLGVKVVGYDNNGNPKPMSGARVTLGASSVLTGSSGRATLRAPSHGGSAVVHASRAGSVPSFPAIVNVR